MTEIVPFEQMKIRVKVRFYFLFSFSVASRRMCAGFAHREVCWAPGIGMCFEATSVIICLVRRFTDTVILFCVTRTDPL